VITSYVKNLPTKPHNVYFFTWSISPVPKRMVRSKSSSIKHVLSYTKIGFYLNRILIRLRLKHKINAVFIHMNPEFVILAAPLCKVLRLPIVFWYLHKKSSLKLLIAHALSNVVVTAHPYGFPISSRKVKVLGHGVSLGIVPKQVKKEEKLLISVGRISRIKRFEEVIKALSIIGENDVKLTIVGPIYDHRYHMELKKLIEKLGLKERVRFLGPIPHDKIAELYLKATLLVSCSLSGLDKVVLEAMSVGLPVIVGTTLFDDLLGKYRSICRYRLGSPEDLAHKIRLLLKSEELREEIGRYLREQALAKHSVDSLTSNLIKLLRSLTVLYKR